MQAAAAALIQPLAWKFSYAQGVALKRLKKRERERDVLVTVYCLLSQMYIYETFFRVSAQFTVFLISPSNSQGLALLPPQLFWSANSSLLLTSEDTAVQMV